MSDDPKLWVALVTGGLALTGTLYATLMSHLGRQEQDHFKAATDKDLAELKARTDRSLSEYKACTDRELARLNAGLQAERDTRLARVEGEKIIARFRDPLMHAAYDLQSRIYNILRQDFLKRYYTNGSPSEREYAVENTVFLFAQFLGWTELIRQEVQFLDLGSDDRTRELRNLQDTIYTHLQSDRLGPSFRLFAGEQRAIGELMVDPTPGIHRCVGYAAFNQSRPAKLDQWLDRLREDVKHMATDALSFNTRLTAIQHSLIDMLRFFDTEFVHFPAACRTKV